MRELENVIERAAILTRSPQVGSDTLPMFRSPPATATAARQPLVALEVVERQHIAEILRQTGFLV